MRTEFNSEQLLDPATAVSESVIRKCVHCGFCTATCPTYVLLGDELDSPRGRIYLIKDMLERDAEPSADVVKHLDRCLSCLSCMTTCPSGVNYMHLIDHARAYVEARYRRPLAERFLRSMLAAVLPHPGRFRLALRLARLVRLVEPLLPARGALAPLRAMLDLAPRRMAEGTVAVAPAAGGRRILLLGGCVEPVLRPSIQRATERLLARRGFAVVRAPGEGCCGALVHHLGREEAAKAAARANIDAWTRAEAEGPLEALVITASGCGTSVKDYGFLLRDEPAYAARAERFADLARDISELLDSAGLPPPRAVFPALTVAYQSACSMQHGQKITAAPVRLLSAAGFTVRQPAEAHLCCGSAGTYNILQPEIAAQLGARKAANLARLAPDIVATGNIGCATHLSRHVGTPIVHTVELLDWATGGPPPAQLTDMINNRMLAVENAHD